MVDPAVYLIPKQDYPKLEWRFMFWPERNTAARAGRPVRVLLVEDDAADAERVSGMLADAKEPRFHVLLSRRLPEALELARSEGCEAVLLGLTLPDPRGVDGLRQLALALPLVPIVVRAGMNDDGAALRLLQHGAQDCLPKGAETPLGLSRAIRCAIERKAFDAALAERAYFDPLTGLASRAAFGDRLRHALDHAARRREQVAVLYLNLDGFKEVNGSLGQDAGDGVLRWFGELLRGVARRSDTAARLGDDEFALVLERSGDERCAWLVAERVLRAFEMPPADRRARVACSIGIATYPDSARDAESLVRLADAAMYGARRSGKNRIGLSPAR